MIALWQHVECSCGELVLVQKVIHIRVPLTSHLFQGAVYNKIIEDVISQCRPVFEEEGASVQVLDDFKKVSTSLSLLCVGQVSCNAPPVLFLVKLGAVRS